MLTGWLYASTMALLPLVGVSGYGAVSMCLPMEARDVWDRLYIVALLVLNGLAFLVICCCYISMFMKVAVVVILFFFCLFVCLFVCCCCFFGGLFFGVFWGGLFVFWGVACFGVGVFGGGCLIGFFFFWGGGGEGDGFIRRADVK